MFKNTNEALAYARAHKNDSEAVRYMGFILKENARIKDIARVEAENARGADIIPKHQAYLNIICKCQFIKEALEEMTDERIAEEAI